MTYGFTMNAITRAEFDTAFDLTWLDQPKTQSSFDWVKAARMALISRALDELEERVLTPQGAVKYQFSARGHELSQVLLAQALNHPRDAAGLYYRNRPFMLAAGLSVETALANGMANAGSLSGGRDVGVTNNLPRLGNITMLPMAADIGSQYSPAAGYAQALRYKSEVLGQNTQGGIVLAVGGDGSVASNGFWAALNMAAALGLPVLFCIEDNGYAISVKRGVQTPGGDIAANLKSFNNLKIFRGSGTEPAETAALVDAAVRAVRTGAGPALLHLGVPRLSGHSSVDTQTYKTPEEMSAEWSHDPISKLHDFLVPACLSEEGWGDLTHEATRVVNEARAATKAHGQPAQSEVTRHIFFEPAHPQRVGGLLADGVPPLAGSPIPQITEPRRLNQIDAIRRTLDVELARNNRLVLFGEDVGAKGGVHAATLGLQAKHGAQRVFDTSLNEEGIIGRAVGMATAGLMPVPEIQFRKYADPCREQLMNAGSLRWRSNGVHAVPMVVRMPGGYRKLGDPWHSVTNEVEYVHAVGWKVAVPSNAEDAVGLLRTALRGNDPVIYFEHRHCYDAAWSRRAYPGDDYVLEFGKARVIQPGDALTVVTWGAMVEQCELAAQKFNGIEIIDLRTLMPWDAATVLASVRKTARCLIVHEDAEVGGFGAEIAAVVAKEAFFDLDAPIERVASPGTLVPFNQHLMAAVVPNAERIGAAIGRMLAV